MKTLKENWEGAYWVNCGEESADGGSGFNTEMYGPFFTRNEAFAVSKICRRENYFGPKKFDEPIVIVEILVSTDDSFDDETGLPGSSIGFKRWEVGQAI